LDTILNNPSLVKFLKRKEQRSIVVKLFFTRTISLIIAAMMINFVIAGTLYAQNYYAANTKITQHKPVIIIKDDKKVSGEEESWFSKYKWWLLAGVVVVGGAAAAGGGGGGGGGSSSPTSTDGGTVTFGW
jgi:hypothetical protein